MEQVGPLFAGDIRRARVSRMRGFRYWRWHVDEMYVKLNGEMVYLWRAVNHEGEVLESYVTRRRDKAAALTFMKKALKRHGAPETLITDSLRSYRAAMNELGTAEKQEVGCWANNRVENSHLPFRRRERAMLRFRQMKSLQKFASVHANVHNHFSLERHLTDRQTYRERRSAALAEWQLDPCPQRPTCIVWRAVRVRLTAPPRIIVVLAFGGSSPSRGTASRT
ncbi:putative transposase [Sphingomonas rubra]|uniref:Putative transposase n=1 Tax=Sphingomonas rubra TaxID=634430 RepID=A0A1I5TG92_9SPHN|nr:transposase [Sphingomonas rubra]SFP82074.1 putative transposase [Sphingomonas rubra]